MDDTQKYTTGVIGIISLVRERINENIGVYNFHSTNNMDYFTVYLLNGRISIPKKMAMNYEVQPSSITYEELQGVANSFVKLNLN